MRKISIVIVISVLMSVFSGISFAEDPNLISNSKMNDIKGWSGVGSGSLTIDSSQNADGDKGSSLKCVYDNGSYYDILTNIKMSVGTTYKISFYAKGSSEAMRILPIRFFESGYAYLPAQTISTKWEQYTFEWTQPEKNSAGAQISGGGTLALRVQDMGTVWLDNVTVIDASYVPEEKDTSSMEYYKPYEYQSLEKSQTIESFADTKGHWAEETISLLKTDGDVHGVNDEIFEPDRNITRAEFLKLLMSRFNLEKNKYKRIYNDVPEDGWYAADIQNAAELGIISELLTSDGSFRPDEPIIREDACIMADSYSAYNKIEDKRNIGGFADDGDISSYAKNEVYSVCRKEIINGFDDGTFRPKGLLTRAEAAQILMNIIELDGKFAIYVDPENGSDTNNATKAYPIKTFTKAQTMVREANDDMKHNIYVLIKTGEHFVDKPLELTAEDSGNNNCNVIYTSYGDGKAIISGGRHIDTNWEVDDAEKGIYKTYVGSEIKTRQMFVNGIRQIRARTESGFKTDNSGINSDESGYKTGDTYFADYRNIRDMELVYYVEWTNPRCGVDKLEKNDDGTVTLKMENPCWGFLMNKEHLKVSNPRWFENQYEFIDEEGEWYLDDMGWLYYKPFSFIDLQTADVVLPTTESLLTVTGDTNDRVENVSLFNLGFRYATWMRPSTGKGYSDAQGGRIRENGDKVPDSAVWIKYAKNLSVQNCEFSKLGLTALNVTDWVENIKITGNNIYDISGAGMYVGNHGQDGGVSGDAYLSQYIDITNNIVHDYGIDYGSSDGIEGMTMSYANVSHNEIYNARYSGLVLGYGASGTRYAIDYTHNYVHDVLNEDLFDGGSIYVTTPTDGTEDRRNTIAYNYLAQQGNWSGVIYPDNYTSYWEIYNNVVDQRRKPMWDKDGTVAASEAMWMFTNGREQNVLYSNYSTTEKYKITSYGAVEGIPVMEVGENYFFPDADWPDEAKEIINNSGLEKEYEEMYPAGIEVVDTTISQISVRKGDSFQVKDYITAFGRKDSVMDLSPLKLIYSTDRPDLISVSDDGTVESIAEGTASLNITIINGDLLCQKRITVNSGDGLKRLRFKKDEVQLYEDTSTNIAPVGVSALGAELELDSVTYTSGDAAVASVDDKGQVTAAAAGTTNIDIKAVWNGEEIDCKIPITVKKHIVTDEFSFDNYLVTSLNNAVTDNSFWVPGLTGDTAETDENGTTFKTPANTVASVNTYGDELLHTKIRIDAEGGWPSISLRAKNREETYTLNTEYMITFGNGGINNVQKFVMGQRRTFDGSAVKCDFEYGKEYDLMIGAVNHEDSVEIIVCIDKKPVMRFKDYDEDRITEEGYIQIYARSGSISLMKVD